MPATRTSAAAGWLAAQKEGRRTRRRLTGNARQLLTRHVMRSRLSWAGFGSLGPGVSVSPHPEHAAAQQEWERLNDAD